MQQSLSTPVACRIIDMEEGYIFKMIARVAGKSFRIMSPGMTGRRSYHSTLEKPLSLILCYDLIRLARGINSGLGTTQKYYV